MEPGDEKDSEAGAGIEPANSGFADRSLTTWLPRHQRKLRVTCDPTVSTSPVSGERKLAGAPAIGAQIRAKRSAIYLGGFTTACPGFASSPITIK